MRIQIKLMSDLCASAGESYNSYIDTDIVFDDYGLPYIPAKRIKGCIREAALELVEFGVTSREVYDSLFGDASNETAFSMDNAYLEGYENLVADLKNNSDKMLSHTNRVLSLYTYSRTQTSLNANGVAEDKTLRTTRVISKGLTFEADMEEKKVLTKEEKDLLVHAVSMVKHIGNGRTRGLGLVEMEVVTTSKETSNDVNTTYTCGEKNKISYIITLKAPVLCKAPSGSQEKSQDYFEGNKVIGVLAQNLEQADFLKLMSADESGDSIIVSNAYICMDGKRCTPVKASLQKKKDQFYDGNGNMVVADMLSPRNEKNVQRTPVGASYASEDGYIKGVDTETNHHHRRPADKSIGRAVGTDGESAFYQLESIRKDQQFAGYILAGKEKAEVILAVLSKLHGVRMGYSRNAEYGNVELEVTGVEDITNVPTEKATEFVVKLNSAAILYNEYGMPSADVSVFKEYVADALQISKDEIQLVSSFLTYETIGGFNVTWRARKPIFTALGKGTVCYFKTTKEVDITPLKYSFIGERVAEGFGEVEVTTEVTSDVTLKKLDQKVGKENEPKTDIISKLLALKSREDVEYAGIKAANDMYENKKSMIGKSEFKASLSKLIQIVKNEKTMEQIYEQINGIESDGKKAICLTMLGYLESLQNETFTITEEEAKRVFLHGFLNQIKYKTYKKGEKTNE